MRVFVFKFWGLRGFGGLRDLWDLLGVFVFKTPDLYIVSVFETNQVWKNNYQQQLHYENFRKTLCVDTQLLFACNILYALQKMITSGHDLGKIKKPSPHPLEVSLEEVM